MEEESNRKLRRLCVSLISVRFEKFGKSGLEGSIPAPLESRTRKEFSPSFCHNGFLLTDAQSAKCLSYTSSATATFTLWSKTKPYHHQPDLLKLLLVR